MSARNAVKTLKLGLTLVTPRARNMVRSVLASLPVTTPGLSTQDIYKLVLQKYPSKTSASTSEHTEASIQPNTRPKPVKRTNRPAVRKGLSQPPHPDHPIKSLRFLKKFVLDDLVEAGELEKVHVIRGGGGLDDNGVALDSVKIGGVKVVLPPGTHINQKEAWVWRFKAQSEGGVEVRYEEESEDADLGPDGWAGNLRFKDVPDIARLFPVKTLSKTAVRYLPERPR